MTDLVKRLYKAVKEFPVIDEKPTALYVEAADRIAELEARLEEVKAAAVAMFRAEKNHGWGFSDNKDWRKAQAKLAPLVGVTDDWDGWKFPEDELEALLKPADQMAVKQPSNDSQPIAHAGIQRGKDYRGCND